MKNVNVDTATNLQLNWLVAKCEGFSYVEYEEQRKKWNAGSFRPSSWAPSTDWSQGGPIIDREKIETKYHNVCVAQI
jgi:hypothetical protein